MADDAKANVEIKFDLNRAIDQTIDVIKAAKGSKSMPSIRVGTMEDPTKPAPVGRKEVRISKQSHTVTFDNGWQAVFEYLELSPASGKSIEMTFDVWYTYVSFENYKQRLVQELFAGVTVNFDTVFARMFSVDVKLESTVRLKAGQVEPTGALVFNWNLSSMTADKSGLVEFVINGQSLSIGNTR